jgi:hypothetical protein
MFDPIQPKRRNRDARALDRQRTTELGTPVSTADVSTPPTTAQLDAIFGTATEVGAGYTAIVDDNGAGTDVYFVWSDGANWNILQGVASSASAIIVGHTHQDAANGGQLDHGAALTGLGDDDHSQYLNVARHDLTARHTLGTVVPHDDHGALSGLADDDHSQYLLASGARAMGGNLDMGAHAITNVGNVDGVDVSAHAARHESGGADAVNHDSLTGFVADEHIAHSSVSISAGGILSGGGTIAASRTISLAHGDVDHDQTDNFVADEHVAHSGVTLTAGNGLTGGGTIAASRTLAVGEGDGIDVAADSIAVDVTDLIGDGLTESGNDIVLGTPSTLTVDTSNGVTASSHTHAITTSSNPGAAASILASDAGGGLTLVDLTLTGDLSVSDALDVTGAADFGDDLTVGSNILFVDYSQSNVGINRAPDSQFDLDVAGSIRGQYIVGKHAIQLGDAVALFHFDGPTPYETDFTGDPSSVLGQVGTTSGGVIWRPGKFYKAVQVAEPTTNLITNPVVDDLTGWAAFGSGSSLSLTTNNTAMFGLSYGSLDGGTSYAYSRAQTAVGVSASTTYTISAYVRAGDASDVGQNMLIGARNKTGSMSEQNTSFTLKGEWTRVSGQFTTASDSAEVWAQIVIGNGSDIQFEFDGVQVEQGSSATPLAYGDMPGHSWSGTAHNSTSSRAAASYTLDDYANDLIQPQGTVMGWWVVGTVPSDSGSSAVIFDAIGADNNNRIYLRCDDGDDLFDVYINGAFRITDTGSGSISRGDEIFWALTWDFDADEYDLTIYEDDGTRYTGSSTAGLTAPTITDVALGTNYAGSANWINGVLDDVVFLARALPLDESTAVYESNAPVFVESSVRVWRSPTAAPIWVDEEGLWGRTESGDASIGWSAVDSKSWAGFTLDEGDFALGRSATNYLRWDDSAGTLTIAGDGDGITNIDGGNIQASTITATELNVSTLSAITADLGTVTAGRVEMLSSGSIAGADGTGLVIDDNLSYDSDSWHLLSLDSGTWQVGIDTSGNLRAGSVTINSDGIDILAGSGTFSAGDAYSITNASGNPVSGITGWQSTGFHTARLIAPEIAGESSFVDIRAVAPSGYDAEITLRGFSGTDSVYLSVVNDYAGGSNTHYVEISDGGGDADLRIGGGLYVGATAVDPDSNDIYYAGNLKSVKTSTYDVYGFHPLSTPLTHTSFDGDSFSDVGTSTIIQNTSWSSTIPADAKALLIEIVAVDSGSWGTAGLFFAVGPTATYWYQVVARPAGGSVAASALAPVTCTNGDIYYRVDASGTDTLDVTLRCWGYWI